MPFPGLERLTSAHVRQDNTYEVFITVGLVMMTRPSPGLLVMDWINKLWFSVVV